MKVTLKYEEHDDKEKHMTLRLTLPQKYVNGTCKEVVRLFVDHYNKKHSEGEYRLDVEALHLKIVGGDHLDSEERVKDVLNASDECYLLPEHTRTEKQAKSAPSQPTPSPAPSQPSAPSAAGGYDAVCKKVPAKDSQGKVRCKNFGCQMSFDPDGEPQPCVHHKAAPIFHETAKWWSCCPDNKAYDFDDFMRIPGCTKSFCTNSTAGQGTRCLGGSDLRAENAPVRLDADAPVDPRKKLNDLRKGRIAIGVDGALFEKVWSQLLGEVGTESMDKVVDLFRAHFEAVLKDQTL
jgi:hypothetical protein